MFKASVGCKEILDFAKLLADSVVGRRVSEFGAGAEAGSSSPAVAQFAAWIDTLQELVRATPPLKQPMRFGNKAFRAWHAALVETAIPAYLDGLDSLAAAASPLSLEDRAELTAYLSGAFGNETRIDYGTGHEVFVLVFFLCLVKLGLVSVPRDCAALVLQGFAAYMKTMRALQESYLLEPAGSHGVWGLDDYHCLPFLFGAAQLVGHATITPRSVHDTALLAASHEDWLYLGCIHVIRRTKLGAPFAETSPMLNDISGMHDWAKVTGGLLRLFQGEVLFKLPVVQHLLFGRFLSMEALAEAEAAAVAGAAAAGAAAAAASAGAAAAEADGQTVFAASANAAAGAPAAAAPPPVGESV